MKFMKFINENRLQQEKCKHRRNSIQEANMSKELNKYINKSI